MPVDSATYSIAPYWVDQYPVTSTCPTCGVFTAITGTAPNRAFVVEWRNAYFPGNATPNLDYEVVLHESPPSEGRFDVAYQLVTSHAGGSLSSLTVGVQQNPTSFTELGCDPIGANPPGGVTSGAYFIYTLTECPTPTATPTPTPTATPTAPATCTPPYTYATGAGTFVPGTNTLGMNCDDCGIAIPLPFPVTLYGESFTTATVGSNGMLAFGTCVTDSGSPACRVGCYLLDRTLLGRSVTSYE